MTRRRGGRRPGALVAGSLLAGACGPAPPPTAPAASTARDLREHAAERLARDAHHHEDPPRRVLYTWTTRAQIEELRRTRRLLSREESTEHGASYLEQVVHALAVQGDPIAVLVNHTGFAKMRFAWHAPWATRAGWPGEEYGDQLIRVTLAPRAIVLSLSTATGGFSARDAEGRPVTLDEVRASPERIGAIYFVSAAAEQAPRLPQPSTTYREVALCNESMIESWEAGTPAIARELANGADTLEAFARFLAAADTWELPAMQVAASWRRPPAAVRDPVGLYAAALALDSRRYRLDPDALRGLAAKLRGSRQGAAVTGGGAPFAGVGAVRPPPRVVPPRARPALRSATYGTFASASIPSGPRKRP